MANTAHDRAAKEAAELRLKVGGHIQILVRSKLEPSHSRFGFGD